MNEAQVQADSNINHFKDHPKAYFIFEPDNLRGFRDLFGPLGGVWAIDEGWWVPIEHGLRVKEICAKLNMDCTETNIIEPAWDVFRNVHSIGYRQKKMAELEEKFNTLAKSKHLEITISDALSTQNNQTISTTLGASDLLNIARQWEKYATQAKRLEQERKISELNTSNRSAIDIKFIRDLPKNFLKEDAPEAPMLLQIMEESSFRGFLRKGIVAQLVGAGGIGKTHFLVQLALSIATRRIFLEKYRVVEKGNVFIGLGENSNDDIHRLLRKITKGLALEDQEISEASSRISVMSFNGQSASFIHKGTQTPFFDALFHQLKVQEPDDGWMCIILDPISRFLGADAEVDNAAATQFIALLEKLTLELKGNPTVLFGHHMSKNSLTNTNTDQTAARGSSAITDGVRWQANLERIKNGDEYLKDMVRFRVVKSNFTAIGESHDLQKDLNGCLYSGHNTAEEKKSPETVTVKPATTTQAAETKNKTSVPKKNIEQQSLYATLASK